jgi:16S rRNA (cytidine1402-2'-O)-methyltransferase
MTTGKVYLFPCPIVEGKIDSLSPESIRHLHQTRYFIVERAKTARHFIKAAGHPEPISSLIIHEMSDDTKAEEAFIRCVLDGHDLGIISEAGCPGVADPGSVIVSWAHKHGVEVVPLIGPSSILLALMASGFNGQRWTFHGYLPNKKPDLVPILRKLESQAHHTTQIWMETPYRNGFMIEACTSTLGDQVALCIACNINAPSQSIITRTIKEWRKVDLASYHKRPAIFIIGK